LLLQLNPTAAAAPEAIDVHATQRLAFKSYVAQCITRSDSTSNSLCHGAAAEVLLFGVWALPAAQAWLEAFRALQQSPLLQQATCRRMSASSGAHHPLTGPQESVHKEAA
jgi:hypothetical protein